MKKSILILTVMIVGVLCINIIYANYSLDYNTRIDNHVKRINSYLIKKPQNEGIVIKALAKKVMQPYSIEKEKEIRYYSELIARVQRTKYDTCMTNKLSPDDSMYRLSNEQQKKLMEYSKNEAYELKNHSCHIAGGTGDAIACSIAVLDTAKYAQGQKYVDILKSLGIDYIGDLSINDIVKRYSVVASFDYFCQKTTHLGDIMSSQDNTIKNLDQIIKNIEFMVNNEWSKVDGKILLGSEPDDNYSQYITQKVYGSGVLLLTIGGNAAEGMSISLIYISKKGKGISIVGSEPFFRYGYDTSGKNGGLYEYYKIPLFPLGTGESRLKKTPLMKVSHITRNLDKKSRQYIIDVFNNKIKSVIFNQALQDVIK